MVPICNIIFFPVPQALLGLGMRLSICIGRSEQCSQLHTVCYFIDVHEVLGTDIHIMSASIASISCYAAS